MALKKEKISVRHVPLYVPDELLVCQVLTQGLQKNFENVQVEMKRCPDLSIKPWSLATKSIGGDCRIADVGGTSNLDHPHTRSKHYSLEEIALAIGKPKAHYMGPGAGYGKVVGVNCELMATAQLQEEKPRICSQVAKVGDQGQCVLEPYASLACGPLINLLISDGDEKATVIHIRASVRKGEKDFVHCLRTTLDQAFPDQYVALAGTFQVVSGSVRAHVMPTFPAGDLCSEESVLAWLRFYEMKAPLTCLSVMINRDIPDLKLRVEHTHFYSDHGEGGHYHCDTTPESVIYEGYFVVPHTLHRIAQPST